MRYMSKLNKILLIIVGILLIALIVVIYWQKIGFQQSYWAVYLNTGDLYFGKLHRFPKLSLSNVWLIQRNPNDQQNPFSLARFTQAFWGPEDKIYLNEKDIVWKTRLSETSQILQYIKNQPAAQAQPSQPTTQTTPQQLPQQPSPSATTTQQ